MKAASNAIQAISAVITMWCSEIISAASVVVARAMKATR